MVREGLRSMLSGEEIEIVGEASTGGEAVRVAADLSPEVVLLDLELPDMDGLTVLRQIKEIAPALCRSSSSPCTTIPRWSAGRCGRGRRGMSSRASGAPSFWPACGLSGTGNQSSIPASCARSSMATQRRSRPAPPLSRVELDLLRLVADGLTNREIGQRLRWSPATVKKYVQRILEKLDVADRTQAAVEGVRRGLFG